MAFAFSKKYALILSLSVLLMAGLVYAYMTYKAPALIKESIISTLNVYNFHNIKFGSFYKNKGYLIFENIQLDEDAFSTIEKISAKYSLLNLFIFGHVDSLKIHTPTITSTLNTENLVDIQKNLMNGTHFRQKWLKKVDHLEILDGKIDLLTKKYAGFTMDFDGQIRKGDDKSRNIILNVSASQKQLSTDIRIKGQIVNDDGWHMEIVLDRSRLDLPHMQLSRINGNITADGKGNTHYSNGEINIGGFKLGELAWGDIAMTFEQSSEDGLKWILAGNALGSKDVEFGLNYNEQDSVNIHGTLYTREMKHLLDYLHNYTDLSDFKNSNFSKISDVFVTYSLPFANLFSADKSLIFNLKKIEENIEIKGNLSISKDNFSVQSLLGPDIVQDVHLAPGIILKSGLLKGAVTYKSNANTANLMASLDNGTINLGAFPLINVKTSFKMDDLAKLSMEEYQKATFSSPLKSSLKHDGQLFFKIADNKIDFKDVKIDLLDGSLSTKNIVLNASSPTELEIDVKNISLEKLSYALDIDNLITGNLQGSGFITNTNKGLIAKNLKLTNTGSGKISIPQALLDTLFDDDNLESDTMRAALKNFRYEDFEIIINGNLMGTSTINFSAKGRNPDILGGRTMSINYETNQNLSSLWQLLSKD